jgi:transcriptional regulator with XRE-family HTH domain
MSISQEDFLRKIGQRIKTLRMSNQFSREYLAELADISPKYLYEIESGKKSCSAYILYRLAFALNTSVDYINDVRALPHTEEIASLVNLFDNGLEQDVFCQVLFPEKSVGIPFFQQGIFPAFSGHYASLRIRACSIR